MAYLDLKGFGPRMHIGGRFGSRIVDKKTGVPREDWSYTHNLITDEGLNKALNVHLSTHAKITTWYVGLKSTTHVSSSATYAVPLFTESTKYSEATRQAWAEGGSTAQSISNSTSVATFSINANSTIDGTFLVGGGTAASTKGDTAGGGTLFAVANFASAKVLSSGDSLQITYQFTAADAT